MNNNYTALIDIMVTHYREALERLEERLKVVEEQNKAIKTENALMRDAYYRMETMALEEETRADQLRQSILDFMASLSPTARRDLIPEFNAVARANEVSIDELLYNSDSE